MKITTFYILFLAVIIFSAVFMGCSKDNPVSSTGSTNDTTIILQLDTFKFVLTNTNWDTLQSSNISVYPDTMHIDLAYRILCDTNISLSWSIRIEGLAHDPLYIAYGDTTGYKQINLKIPIHYSSTYKIIFLLYLGNLAQVEMRLEDIKIWYVKQ